MDDEAQVGLLQDLVRIPSVNPGEGLDDPDVSGEARLAAFLAEYLDGLGFEAVLEEQVPGRPNVIAAYGPAEPGHSLLLEAHLDTVSTRDMTVPPFAAEIRDGRLYGRGACDTKGPMAAALGALDRRLLDDLATAGCRVQFAGAIDEEKGAEGAAFLARTRRVTADEAIILEPTGLDLVNAHKGVFWLELETDGVTAHGSNPAAGVSAIRGMTEVMEWLRANVGGDEAAGPAMGHPTLNIGRIEGGSAVNIVPGRCRIEADLRTVPGTDHAAVARRIRDGLDALSAAGKVVGYRLNTIKECPPFETRSDCPLANRLRAACRAQGVDPATVGTGWFSDAGPLAAVCDDLLVFGPGHIAQAHTPDEFIELHQLAQGARILRCFLEAMLDELSGRGAG